METHSGSLALANWGRGVALLSCLGLVIGAFAPWSTTGLESAAGAQGDGQYTGTLGLVAGLVVFGYGGKRPGWLTVITVFAVFALLLAIVNMSLVNEDTDYFFGREVHTVSIGWGLWLTGVSALALSVGSFRYRWEERGRKIAEKVDRKLEEEEEEREQAAPPAAL